MRVLTIIGARLNSSRLPGKHLLTLAGLPMIERTFQRLAQSKYLSEMVVATTNDDFNRPLVEWGAKTGHAVFAYQGDVNDLIGRIDSLVQSKAPADFILYLCGDCPLVDPDFIDFMLENLAQSGADAASLPVGQKTIHEGICLYSAKGWQKLVSASTTAPMREHVGYADTLLGVLTKTPLPANGPYYGDFEHRISVDTEADHRFMDALYRRWYQNHPASEIVDFSWAMDQIAQDANLRNLNAHVQQKLADQAYGKSQLFCHVTPQIGLGHLRRTALIASALQEHLGMGTEIIAAGQPQPLDWLKTNIRWVGAETEFLTKIHQASADLVVVDIHPEFIDQKLLGAALDSNRQRGARVLGIDKTIALKDHTNFTFVPSLYTGPTDPKVSGGLQNFLYVPAPSLPKQEQVLVLTGGSDALGLGQTLPTLLNDCPWPVIWVQGPMAPAPILPPNSPIKVVKNPDNLGALMAGSEIVLSTYGLSLFETLGAGAATILLPSGQLAGQAELHALAADDICLVTQDLAKVGPALSQLCDDVALRQNLQNRAAKAVNAKQAMSNLIACVKAL